MRRILTLAVSIATAAAAVAAPQPAIDVATINDKVSIRLGQQLQIKFTANGHRLLQPRSVGRADTSQATVGIKLRTTDSTPFRVPGVATRPYLVVSNGLERPLHYRALARIKGSKEFFAFDQSVEPIAPGEQSQYCWESGSLVEEVILYQFALSPKPSP